MDTSRVRSLIQAPCLRGLAERYVDEGLRGTLQDALEIACLASLHQNEGRNLRFALVFEAHPRRPDHLLQPFRSPIELSAGQLQSISAAFSPESYCFVVARGAGAAAGPLIIGTTPRPRAVLPPPQLYHPPVVVDVEAPGVVSLSIGEAKAVFKRGEILEQSRGIPGPLLRGETEELVRRVCAPEEWMERGWLQGGEGILPFGSGVWEALQGEIRAIVRRSVPRVQDRTLQSIARRMVRARRGGAVLVLPAGGEREGLFHGGRWYRRPDPQLQRELVRLLGLEVLHRLATTGRLRRSSPPASGADPLVSWASERLRTTLAAMETACQNCADLTKADGATILGADFGIEGFSAKLTSFEGELPGPLARFLETRGNRHRATAGAIARQRGAVGLVVSQDGEITVFHHQGSLGPRHVEIVL